LEGNWMGKMRDLHRVRRLYWPRYIAVFKGKYTLDIGHIRII
jgi:hypothetical protein